MSDTNNTNVNQQPPKKWTPQQMRAIEQTDTDLIVTAGAGSGKTATMIERACRLVLDKKVPIRRITMLTFTEKAAAEMKEKFRVRLMQALNQCTPQQREYIIEQIDSIPYAAVCTIDSYCYGLVREYFAQIPLSPNIRVIDETAAECLFAKAFQRLLDQNAGDRGFDAMRTMVGLRTDRKLYELLQKLYENMAIQPTRRQWLADTYAALYDVDFDQTVAVRYLLNFVTYYTQKGCQALRDYLPAVVNQPKTTKSIGLLLQRYQAFETCAGYADICKAYQQLTEVKGNCLWDDGPLKDVLKQNAALLVDVRDIVKDFVDMGSPDEVRATHAASAPFVKRLFDLVLDLDRLYSAEKQAQGALDFNDVERYTMQLLQQAGLRAEIQARHDYVFVDEFQDINYLQSAIIDSISPPNRLFVVGDSKQCIYRFRLAEPQIFLDRVQQWQKEGNNVGLLENFRSDNGILRFVNRVFGRLMTKSFGGVDYSQTDYFRPREGAPDSGDCVVKVCLQTNWTMSKPAPQGIYSVQDDCPAEDADSLEGMAIVRYIRALYGTTVVVDNKIHTISYSSFAILTPSRNAVKDIVKYLQKEGIPLDLGGVATDVGLHQVHQLLHLADLLDNEQQDYPLLTVMRSPFGGFGDADLAAIRMAGDPYAPYWQVLRHYADTVEGALADRVRDFLQRIRRYRFQAAFTPLATLFGNIMSETGFWDYLALCPDAQARIGAVNTFLAKVAGGTYGTNLVDFCQYFRLNELEELAVAPQGDQDRVIVSTIHASKGLQYPVVIVAGCNSSSKGDSDEIQCDGQMGVGTYYYDVLSHWRYPTFVHRAIALKHRLQNREDKLRLFYVACTRAQCCMLLTGVKSRKKDAKNAPKEEVYSLPIFQNTFASWLQIALRDEDTLFGNLMGSDVDTEAQSVAAVLQQYYSGAVEALRAESDEQAEADSDLPSIDPYSLDPEYTGMLKENYLYDDVVQLGKKYTVTALNERDTEGDALPASFLQEELQSAVGTAYHTVFQYIDYNLSSIDQLRDYLHQLVEDGVLDAATLASIDVDAVWRCLQLPLLKQAGQCATGREQRFLLQQNAADLGLGPDQKVLVQGVIDLVIVHDGKAIVVDFKHSRRSAQALRQAYGVQLALYRMAVQQAMGLPVSRCVLVEINRAMVVDMP